MGVRKVMVVVGWEWGLGEASRDGNLDRFRVVEFWTHTERERERERKHIIIAIIIIIFLNVWCSNRTFSSQTPLPFGISKGPIRLQLL